MSQFTKGHNPRTIFQINYIYFADFSVCLQVKLTNLASRLTNPSFFFIMSDKLVILDTLYLCVNKISFPLSKYKCMYVNAQQ